ncbi:hypothetical protein HanHA300_Chr10g0350631 [Helianthus annuus]|nr:hypothetical protein HanHA300_Chr10g0350631 [Helianthus annuus]KAJ0528959.1 hypothetical protein HanHA89_Chr10g0372331 [Helianthus annuus]KAJ0695875.1 hypothetical protein HanLR1_Chr10g0350551 [Helianthus annuus]
MYRIKYCMFVYSLQLQEKKKVYDNTRQTEEKRFFNGVVVVF